MPDAARAAAAHRFALGCLLILMLLCVMWEWWLAPIRGGGSWLILKALPLAVPIHQLWRNPATRRYTYQWSSLLIWFYFTEGAVRAWSDRSAVSQGLALLEVALCVMFFFAAIIYIRNTPSLPR